MPSRSRRKNVQEDTVSTDTNTEATEYDGNTIALDADPNAFAGENPAEAAVQEDLDVETPTEPDADDEVEELPAGTDASEDAKPKAAKKEKAQPKRGELPDGYVTPIGLTKAINERGLYRNREGEVAELKPQMVYSYIKNAPKDRPYPGETVTDSVGASRENCVTLEKGLEWWKQKNAAADERRKNAAEKAAKAKAAKEKKEAAGDAATTEAEDNEPAGVVEEAE